MCGHWSSSERSRPASAPRGQKSFAASPREAAGPSMRRHNSLPARVKQRDLVCGAQVQGVHPRGRATTHTTHPRRPRHGDTSVSTNSIFSLNLFFSNSKNYFFKFALNFEKSKIEVCKLLKLEVWNFQTSKLKFADVSNLKFGIFKLHEVWKFPNFKFVWRASQTNFRSLGTPQTNTNLKFVFGNSQTSSLQTWSLQTWSLHANTNTNTNKLEFAHLWFQ